MEKGLLCKIAWGEANLAITNMGVYFFLSHVLFVYVVLLYNNGTMREASKL
jgi:hypothetical protein